MAKDQFTSYIPTSRYDNTQLYNSRCEFYGQKVKCNNGTIAQLQLIQDEL